MKSLLKYLFAILLLLVCLMAYFAVRERGAEQAAAAFCAEVKTGMAAAEIQRRLAANRAHDHVIDAPNGKLVIFTGVPPFSRHICRIDMAAGRVTGKHLEYLD